MLQDVADEEVRMLVAQIVVDGLLSDFPGSSLKKE
jgi:hypothetical protein